MTYPQQPYGQQPDPYGQGSSQASTAAPQAARSGTSTGLRRGGYPQQPAGGQYGGYDPTAQYPQSRTAASPASTAAATAARPPPKKNTGPIIAIVAIVVLLLGGLGVTGFVAPGFFLSRRQEEQRGRRRHDDVGRRQDARRRGVHRRARHGRRRQGQAALRASPAPTRRPASTRRDRRHRRASRRREAEGHQGGVRRRGQSRSLDITVDGDARRLRRHRRQGRQRLVLEGHRHAAVAQRRLPTGRGVRAGSTRPTPPTGGGSGGDGEQFVQGFLDQVNGGDAAGAKAMLVLGQHQPERHRRGHPRQGEPADGHRAAWSPQPESRRRRPQGHARTGADRRRPDQRVPRGRRLVHLHLLRV